MGAPMAYLLLHLLFLLYAILPKSQALHRKFTSLTSVARPVFVQPLSLTPFDSSPSRGASGETVHFAGTAKASPTRGGGIASAMTERLYEGKPDREPPAGLPSPSLLRNDTSPKGRGFGIPHRFLYLFGEVYDILVLRPCPPILLGRG